MNGVIIGIAANGERIPFERWIIRRYLAGELADRMLINQLERCGGRLAFRHSRV